MLRYSKITVCSKASKDPIILVHFPVILHFNLLTKIWLNTILSVTIPLYIRQKMPFEFKINGKLFENKYYVHSIYFSRILKSWVNYNNHSKIELVNEIEIQKVYKKGITKYLYFIKRLRNFDIFKTPKSQPKFGHISALDSPHTDIFEYFCLPVFLDIHRNLKQKEFLNTCEGFIHFYPHGYAHGRSLRHILDKHKKWHFHSTSNEVIWPKKFQISFTGKKVTFWQFFRMGWDGRTLLSQPQPSRIPHRNWKIIFVLAADEYIERLEGKIIECLFFYVKIF
jgi:hypothetical protein